MWRNNHKEDKEFIDFISYNDLGLPLAFLIDSEIVTATEIAIKYIEETWIILLASIGVEDVGFESLEDLFKHRTDSED